jgi:hypothetical protein
MGRSLERNSPSVWFFRAPHLASPSGSFFLLDAFRRFTFCLDENSVAFALASCLGGAPVGFHVKFQSERHF